MPLLYLSSYELLTLSSCSRIKADRLSPLTRLYAEGALDYNEEKMKEAVLELLNSNYITGSNGKKLLAKELEPAFFILHQPDKVVSFKRLSFADINEVYFCFKSGAAVQYTKRYDSLFETLVYPFTRESVIDWVQHELFKGIMFDGKKALKPFEINLSVDETIVLLAVINIYRNRILSKKEALSPDETWITFKEIREFEGFNDVRGFLSLIFNKDDIKKYLSENEKLPEAIENLIKKDILTRSNRGLSYSGMCKDIFDPGNVTDCIVVKEADRNNASICSLNVLDRGYMLFSQADNKLDYNIRTFPKETHVKTLAGKLFTLKESPSKSVSDVRSRVKPKFCTNCGSKVGEHSKFCINCGNKIIWEVD